MSATHPQASSESHVSLRRVLSATSALPAVALATMMIAAPSDAHADLNWTFSGAIVADTRTAATENCPIGGCFVDVSGTVTVAVDAYDDASIVSWSIVTSATGLYPSLSWNDSNSTNPRFPVGNGPGNFSLISNAQPSDFFDMTFDGPLTGYLNPDRIGFADLGYTGMYDVNGEFGPTVGGVVLEQSMPEPSSLAILGAALSFFGFGRWRPWRR